MTREGARLSSQDQMMGFFAASRSTDQLDLPNNAITDINMDLELVDYSGWYAFNGSIWVYTPQVQGHYVFSANVRIRPTVANLFAVLYIKKNGALHHVLGRCPAVGTSDVDVSGVIYGTQANGTTDYFNLGIYHNFNNLPDIAGNNIDTWWTGGLLGAF
jgi:hypothetical protein